MTAYSKAANNGRIPELVADLDWYALLVPPQKEFAAQEFLHNRYGVATFCPFDVVFRHKSPIAKAKGLEKVERRFPIMPRYVFAGFVGTPPWWRLFNHEILTGVVGLNGTPLKIGDRKHPVMTAFVRKFKNGLRRPNEERFMRTHHEYKVGDLATIVEGALRDRVVEVDEITDDGKAFFKIEVFNSEHRLSLPIAYLEAA